MEQKQQKGNKSKGPSFYLKIAFGEKTKKFRVRNPRQISLKQIKSSFTPTISATNIKIEILEQGSIECTVKTEEQLIGRIQGMDVQENGEVRINIVEETSEKLTEHHNNSEDEEQDELPGTIKKVRSRSQEIELDYKTQSFMISSY